MGESWKTGQCLGEDSQVGQALSLSLALSRKALVVQFLQEQPAELEKLRAVVGLVSTIGRVVTVAWDSACCHHRPCYSQFGPAPHSHLVLRKVADIVLQEHTCATCDVSESVVLFHLLTVLFFGVHPDMWRRNRDRLGV